MDEATLLSHLRTLVDTRLVTAASPEAFEFRHALTREAVYSTLLKRQRVVYHGLVADILEAQNSAAPGAARAADLAFHYREAGNWPKVLAYAQQAGEQAQKMYASREAAEHFSHALTAAAQLGQAPIPALLRGRGQAYETLGEFEAARADYEHGLSAARRGRHPFRIDRHCDSRRPPVPSRQLSCGRAPDPDKPAPGTAGRRRGAGLSSTTLPRARWPLRSEYALPSTRRVR